MMNRSTTYVNLLLIGNQTHAIKLPMQQASKNSTSINSSLVLIVQNFRMVNLTRPLNQKFITILTRTDLSLSQLRTD